MPSDLLAMARACGRVVERRRPDGSWTPIADDEDLSTVLFGEVRLSSFALAIGSSAVLASATGHALVRPRRGPKSTKEPTVEQQILARISEGESLLRLAWLPQRKVRTEFGVSHQTYEKAFSNVIKHTLTDAHMLALIPERYQQLALIK